MVLVVTFANGIHLFIPDCVDEDGSAALMALAPVVTVT
jgi:hypothetical protein